MFFFIKPSPQEKVVRECLGELYNIPDFKIYKEIIETMDTLETMEQLSEFASFNYDKYCTKKGLEKIVVNRIHMFYRHAAYKKQFTVKLKDISLEKYSESKEKQEIRYRYQVKLIINFVNSDKVETVYEKGHVTVVKVNKEWKIDSLGTTDYSDVFND